jgi:4-hydroxy 2-oxovalerate aldolase
LDNNIIQIYKKKQWGYSLKFYIAALNDCHPLYVEHLLNKKMLPVASINTILSRIESERKLTYDNSYAEELYIAYQKNDIDDSAYLERLAKSFEGKKLLLLAPGNSLITEAQQIREFIKINNPIIIAVNFITTEYPADYVFVSNAKRYHTYFDLFRKKELQKTFQLITTSNIPSVDGIQDYLLDYSKLLGQGEASDNSVLMFLRLLSAIGVANIAVAGFDGYVIGKPNYFDDSMDHNSAVELLTRSNNAIRDALAELRRTLNIQFVTPSVYLN